MFCLQKFSIFMMMFFALGASGVSFAQESKPASKPSAETFTSTPAIPARGPQPGEVYKVFELHLGKTNADWRVTDRNAKHKGAQRFIPSPVHTFVADDLKDAVRAEIMLDRWGGHTDTYDKSLRINGNAWLALPDIQNTPEDPRSYMSQDNPMIEIPLEYLQEGENTLEGACKGTSWGQWGMYSVALRVYYDPAKKPHAKAEIISPKTGDQLAEQPLIEVSALDAEVAIEQVEVLARYEDYDFDGNGVYREWAGSWHQPKKGEPAFLANHVGTDSEAPFQVTWDTEWVPDQTDEIELIARVRDANGVWSVTPAVTGLMFADRERSVALYKASEMPSEFWVHKNNEHLTKTCKIVIPENVDLSKLADARLYMRTWGIPNSTIEGFLFNDLKVKSKGLDHHYALSAYDIPVDALKHGENTITFEFDTRTEPCHLEILWPGPGLVVRSKPLNAAAE